MGGSVTILKSGFWSNDCGQVALTFASGAIGLAAVLTLVINTGTMADRRQSLQDLIDETAMSMAVEIGVISQVGVDLESIALARLNPRLAAEGQPTLLPGEIEVQTLRLAPLPDPVPPGGVADDAVQILVTTNLSGLIGSANRPMEVRARAQRLGSSNLCVIALDTAAENTIHLNSSARLTAPNCDIVSNSAHAQGVNAADASKIRANEIHSAGGTAGQALNFDPAPTTDSLVQADPLLAIPEPTMGACDVDSSQPWQDTGLTLSPGVYCRGLRIDGSRDVIMQPGAYIMLDDLEIASGSLTANGVTIFFAGDRSRLNVSANTELRMTAPVSGPTAGLLFFESRSGTAGNVHEIRSRNARYMVGTVYIPRGKFRVNTDAPISDQSEYTAIVARNLELYDQSNLFLNTDYDATDVPTPLGIGRLDEGVRLAE